MASATAAGCGAFELLPAAAGGAQELLDGPDARSKLIASSALLFDASSAAPMASTSSMELRHRC